MLLFLLFYDILYKNSVPAHEQVIETVGTMDAYQMTSQSLAYLGDSVLEVKVREYLVKEGLSRSAALNRAALSFVTAARQSEAVR
jgi:23S rRNA maturation mini-RNase III